MICLYGETAMEFWRFAQIMEARVIDAYAQTGSCPEEDELVLTNYLEGKRIKLATCGAPSLKRDHIEHLAARYMLTPPLKLAVGRKGDNRNIPGLAQTSNLSSCANLREFIVIDNELAVSSPSFCLLSNAETHDEISLAISASNLLASFVIDKKNNGKILQVRKLAAKDELLTCVSELAKSKSRRQVGRANNIMKIIGHVAENSYSPRESALQLLFCLPKRLGGFELPLPELNPTLYFPGNSILKPDLYWEAAKISIEYNGIQFHTSEAQLNNDAERKSHFTANGIKVIDFDNRLINNVAQTRKIALEIATAHGIRFRTTGKLFGEKHLTLRSRLLAPSHL